MSAEKKLRCPDCNEEISALTFLCPKCGAKIKVYGALVYLETGDIVVLEEDRQIIGRNNLEFANSRKISRNHVMVSVEGGIYFMEDMGSTNGTMVNGQAIAKGDKVTLHNGDIISLAGEIFSFLITAKPNRSDVQSSAEETVLI